MHVYTGTKLTTSDDFSGLQKQYYWYFYFYMCSLALVNVMTLPNFARIYCALWSLPKPNGILPHGFRLTAIEIMRKLTDSAKGTGVPLRQKHELNDIVTSDCFYHAQNFVF